MNLNTTGGAITAVVATALMATVVIQFLSWVKSIRAKDWNGLITPLLTVVVAFLAVQLFAHSSFGVATIPGLDTPVKNLSIADSFIAAIALFGPAGFLYDAIKARDNTQSAAQPSLIPGPSVNPPGGNA